MSPISRALRHRFEDVCRLELLRLRRKTASLPPEQRAEIEALSVEVTQAISAHVEAILDQDRGEDLQEIVGRIFAIAPQDVPGREVHGDR